MKDYKYYGVDSNCIYCHGIAMAKKSDGGVFRVGCFNEGCELRPHFFVSLLAGQTFASIKVRVSDLWSKGDFVNGRIYVFGQSGERSDPEPRIYKAELAAWLDGLMIQCRRNVHSNWIDYDVTDKIPDVDNPNLEWRIKPRCDVFFGRLLWRGNIVPVMEISGKTKGQNDNVKMTFESGELVGVELLAKDCDNDSIYE